MFTVDEIDALTAKLQSDDPVEVAEAMDQAKIHTSFIAQDLVKLLAACERLQHHMVENLTNRCEQDAISYAEHWKTVDVNFEKNMRHRKDMRVARKEIHEHFRVARMEMVFVN